MCKPWKATERATRPSTCTRRGLRARGFRSRTKIDGTKQVKDKKKLKQIIQRNVRAESVFKKWVDWQRRDPRSNKRDQVRKELYGPATAVCASEEFDGRTD